MADIPHRDPAERARHDGVLRREDAANGHAFGHWASAIAATYSTTYGWLASRCS